MNRGNGLIIALWKLGCPLTGTLTASSFDHLFEDGDLRAFLREFCIAVETGHLLSMTDNELHTLDKMEKSGKSLDDDILLKTLFVEQKVFQTNDCLRKCETFLPDDFAVLKNYEKYLIAKQQVLSNVKQKQEYRALLLQKKLALVDINSHQKTAYCKKRGWQMSETLCSLGHSLEKTLDNEYWPSNRSVSRLDLNSYLNAERKLVENVQNFCRNNFTENAQTTSLSRGINKWKRDYNELKKCLQKSGRLVIETKAGKLMLDVLISRDVHCHDTLLLRQNMKCLQSTFDASEQELNGVVNLRTANQLDAILSANYQLKLDVHRRISLTILQVLKVVLWQQSRLNSILASMQLEFEQEEKFAKLVERMKNRLTIDIPSLAKRQLALKNEKDDVSEADPILKYINIAATSSSTEILRKDNQYVSEMQRTLEQANQLLARVADGMSVREPLQTLGRRMNDLEKLVANLEVNAKKRRVN